MFHTCIDCQKKKRHVTEHRCLICHKKFLELEEKLRQEESERRHKEHRERYGEMSLADLSLIMATVAGFAMKRPRLH